MKRPVGQTTRGKTAHNRLRRVDAFLDLYAGDLLRRRDGLFSSAWFVDLGYGAEPFTTLESAARLRRLNPDLPVLGVEIDPERVANAIPYASPHTHFRLGGFNLPLNPGETARVIRAFNVLRQYEEDQVPAAHATLCSYLLPGGLLIEGTSDPFGRTWVANLLRKPHQGPANTEAVFEGVLFSTNFHAGFEPDIFQPFLPKNFIHRMLPGEAIFEFIESWKRSSQHTIAHKSLGLRQWFAASAQFLASYGFHIEQSSKFLRRGYLLWKWV